MTTTKEPQSKRPVAAAILLAIVFFGSGTDKAWSVEQTITAMKKIDTVHITGRTLCRGKPVDFDCWVRALAEGPDQLRMRYQCGCERKTTLVVQGSTVYRYQPKENLVNILDGSQIEALQYWYEGAMISPWLTGKLIDTLKLIGRNWEQTTAIDPNTGQERILITCSHPKSNVSALLIVDPETKLVLKAKLWKNLQREGEPQFDAQTIVYNPEVPQGLFEFQVPPGAVVVTAEEEEQSLELFAQAQPLFHKEKKYAEAMALYRQIHEKYPHTGPGRAAAMMIGLCHEGLKQRSQTIAAYQRALEESPEGLAGAVQFYLGRAYMDNGQMQEALKTFEDCLTAGEGIRDPKEFPLKDAREYIAKIKSQ